MERALVTATLSFRVIGITLAVLGLLFGAWLLWEHHRALKAMDPRKPIGWTDYAPLATTAEDRLPGVYYVTPVPRYVRLCGVALVVGLLFFGLSKPLARLATPSTKAPKDGPGAHFGG